MGLMVGVAQIDYLDLPNEAAREFISHLSSNAEEADWHMVAPMHQIVEYTRGNQSRLMDEYIAGASDLIPEDVGGIKGWVDGLPWKNGSIMLHFGW